MNSMGPALEVTAAPRIGESTSTVRAGGAPTPRRDEPGRPFARRLRPPARGARRPREVGGGVGRLPGGGGRGGGGRLPRGAGAGAGAATPRAVKGGRRRPDENGREREQPRQPDPSGGPRADDRGGQEDG